MNIDNDSIKSQEMNSRESNNINNIDSDEISLSQLEMMANKKKLSKKSEEISISEIMESVVKSEDKTNKSKTKKSKHESLKTDSTLTSESIIENRKKEHQRNVKRENNDESSRKQKSEFLYKFNKLNTNGKWSSLSLDMNNSLDEIQNEYERIRNEIQNERSVAFLKRMMLLGVQGIEMMNTKFDPLGMDLDGWSEAMGYSMENQEYDEVLGELYEKYKGRGQMSPEVKFIFMIISSATMFTVSKKIAKLDSTNMLKSLLGNVMQQPQQPSKPQQRFQQSPQTKYNDNDSDTTEDDLPSKLRGPSMGGDDDINIRDILKTMNERKQQEQLLQNMSDNDNNTEDVIRNISINPQKRGRGRPKKSISVNRG